MTLQASEPAPPPPPPHPDPVRALFERAAACEGESRWRLLEQARKDAPDICDEVEGMLRHLSHGEGVLDRAVLSVVGFDTGSADLSPSLAAAEDERRDGSLPVGTTIAGYRIVRLIGVGGAAAVYEARRVTDDLVVALKLIRPELVSADMFTRFEREATDHWVAGALGHPGLVPIHEAGCVEFAGSLRPFIAMELVAGQRLADYARALGMNTSGKLELIAQVCDALSHAHERGLQHGRLRPSGIVVDQRPRVLDVGTSRLLGVSLTDDLAAGGGGGGGGRVGKRTAETIIDPRIDVLALGAIMYELLVGRRPAQEGETGTGTEVPMPPSRFDPSLRGEIDAIVRCAIAPNPSQRYASMAEMASDIRRCLTTPHPRPHPTGPKPEQLARARRRQFWRVAAIATGATLAGVFAKMLWGYWGR